MSNYSKNKKIEKAFNGEYMYIHTSAEEVNPESMQNTNTNTNTHTHAHRANPRSMQGVCPSKVAHSVNLS
jgi:hypothetical protein